LRSAWSETLFTAQDPVGGGFRTQVLDAETPSQAWSSAQALVALFAVRRGLDRVERLRAAFEYIERDRRDGGWTIVDGPHQEPVTEIAAWVTVAHCAALDSGLLWSGAETAAVEARIDRDVALLRSLQDASGGWSPVRHLSTRNLRTYSSITALWALAAVARRRGDDQLAEPLRRGLAWLWATRKPDLGWVPNPSRPRQHDGYVGLDAQILAVLLSMEPALSAAAGRGLLGRNPAFEAAKRDLLDAPELMSRRFGHNDRVDNLDQAVEGGGFLLEGSSFLWCPWSLRAITLLQRDETLDPGQRRRAGEVRQRLAECLFEGRMEVGDRGTFEVAEALLSLADPEAGDPA
jgi:hypothetical protein